MFDIIIVSIIKENKIYNLGNTHGKIIIYNQYLKFTPLNNMNPNLEFSEQYLHPFKKQNVDEVDLRFYINYLKQTKTKMEDVNVLNYNNIIEKFQFEFNKVKYNLPNNKYIFNLKPSENEITSILFYKLEYNVKLTIIQTILNKKIHNNPLSINENNILLFLNTERYIINTPEINKILNIKYKSSKKKSSKKKSSKKKSSKKKSNKSNIYGFIITNLDKVIIYKYSNDENKFIIDNAYNTKIINYRLKQFKLNKINTLFGYNTIDTKNSGCEFKIMDLRDTNKKSQKGSKCIDKHKSQIIKYYEIISTIKIKKEKKVILCNDLELLFIRKNNNDVNTLWLLNDLDYQLYLL